MMEPEIVDPRLPEPRSTTATITPATTTTTIINTTTSTTTTTRRVVILLRFDPSYIRTVPGMLKIVQMVLNLIGFICISVSMNDDHSIEDWFGFVSMTGFWVTTILFFFYLTHFVEKFPMVPWMQLEFWYTTVWAIFYLTASIPVAVCCVYLPFFEAAAFFGFSNVLVYGTDAFLKYRGGRNGDLAQGERPVQTSPPEIQSTGPIV